MDHAVITALATLLGAGVGGFTTYFTSKAAFTRQESAETKRQHDALTRDVSVRFVKALVKLRAESNSSKAKELAERFDEIVSSNQDAKNLIEQIKAGTSTTTPEQAAEILFGAVEPTPAMFDEQNLATALPAALDKILQMVEQTRAELTGIAAEMQLIMPTEILERAYIAEIATLLAFASVARDKTADAAVLDFVTAVRSHFGLRELTFLPGTKEDVVSPRKG
jgi:hypothetical protein